MMESAQAIKHNRAAASLASSLCTMQFPFAHSTIYLSVLNNVNDFGGALIREADLGGGKGGW